MLLLRGFLCHGSRGCIDYFELVIIFCIEKIPNQGDFQIFRAFLVLFLKVKVFFCLLLKTKGTFLTIHIILRYASKNSVEKSEFLVFLRKIFIL